MGDNDKKKKKAKSSRKGSESSDDKKKKHDAKKKKEDDRKHKKHTSKKSLDSAGEGSVADHGKDKKDRKRSGKLSHILKEDGEFPRRRSSPNVDPKSGAQAPHTGSLFEEGHGERGHHGKKGSPFLTGASHPPPLDGPYRVPQQSPPLTRGHDTATPTMKPERQENAAETASSHRHKAHAAVAGTSRYSPESYEVQKITLGGEEDWHKVVDLTPAATFGEERFRTLPSFDDSDLPDTKRVPDFPEVPQREGGTVFEIREESFLAVMKPIVSHQLEAMSTLKHLQRQASTMLGDDDPFTVKGPGSVEAPRKEQDRNGLLMLVFFLFLQVLIQLFFRGVSFRAYLLTFIDSLRG